MPAVDTDPPPRTGARRSRPEPTPSRRPPSRPAATSGAPATGQLGPALQQLAVTAIDRLAGIAADKVDELAGRLEDVAVHGMPTGVKASALMGGGLAALQGKNPVWAAGKAAFAAMSPGLKIAIGLLLVLAAVLAPVTLLVVALALIVLGIAGAIAS